MANDDDNAAWREALAAWRAREDAARSMGGDDRLARQRAHGRLDARARIEAFADADSFREIGSLVGSVARREQAPVPADGLVAGTARVDGRPVAVWAEDFTVRGGSIGHGNNAKRVRLCRLALEQRIPLVMILEGAGERATNALERYPYAPTDLQIIAELSGRVPLVAVVLGASAGHGALTGLLADFVVASNDAALFSAGPPLVAAALGETVDKQALGGVSMHASESGVVHNVVDDDAGALHTARRYLGFFPSNAWQLPPSTSHSSDAAPRRLDGVLDIIPRDAGRPYDVRRLLAALADVGEVLEVQPDFGRSMVTALVRLGGRATAVVANQPLIMAGSITHDAADKAAHFIDVAGSFHLPVLFLADNPGIMAGSVAERQGTLRSAARMYAAQAALRSPKLHVTLRKAFGFGSSLMAMNPFDRQTVTLALPAVTLGGMPASSGGTAAKVDEHERGALESAQADGALLPADNMSYDRVVDPRDLRNELLAALELADLQRGSPSEPVARIGNRP
jgi:acetyl-CoA carboxylase carboxyltransferase component